MSQPMTGEEVKAAYAAGRRDFRGADLRGADLAGAVLPGLLLGSPTRWAVGRALLSGVIGMFAGAFLALSGVALEGFLETKSSGIGMAGRATFGAIILLLYGLLLRRGAVAGAVAGAVVVVVAIALTLAGAGAGADAVAIAAAILITVAMSHTLVGAVAIAGALAGAGAIALAGSVASAVAGTVAVAVAVALAVIFKDTSVGGFSLVLAAIVAQILFAWGLRRRALRGAPQHAGLRQFSLAFASLGSTRLDGANLSDADLRGSHLRGADLRGARLRRTRLHRVRDLDWTRTAPGPLRSVPVLHLLHSGAGADRAYADLDLCELDLSACDLRCANLSGCDLRGTALPAAAKLTGAILKRARIDALTYQSSHATPDDLADWHERGIEIVALEAFPLPAQERIAGEREGLKLYFSTRLGALQKLLIDGVVVGVLGPGTSCHYEYTVQGDLAIVRLFDAPRADLERVAEALHRRVWEQASEQTSSELAVLRGFLGPVDLRAGLSELVQRLQRMTLRTDDSPAAPATTALALRGGATPAKGGATTRWDWQRPTDPSGGQLALETPLRVLLLFCAADRALADALHRHLQLLHNQGAIVLSRADDLLPGAVIAAERAERLRSADALLVLLSGDLLADEDCADLIAAALAPREGRALHLIPIPLHPCEWRTTALGQREPLPKDGAPIAAAASRDGAFAEVASGLRRLALSQA